VRHSALLMTSPADLIVISDSFDGGNINRKVSHSLAHHV